MGIVDMINLHRYMECTMSKIRKPCSKGLHSSGRFVSDAWHAAMIYFLSHRALDPLVIPPMTHEARDCLFTRAWLELPHMVLTNAKVRVRLPKTTVVAIALFACFA